MTTETPRHPGLRMGTEDNRPPARWPWLRMLVVLVVLLAGCLAVLWMWSRTSERRSLAAMDPAQRSVLFEETHASFRTMCTGPGVDGLAMRCRSQAEFLANFPECDAACRTELSASLRRPSR